MSKITKEDLYQLSAKIDGLKYTLEEFSEKETPPGFKVMFTKLNSELFKHKAILKTAIEAFDYMIEKEKKNGVK